MSKLIPGLVAIIPAYNEAANLQTVVKAVSSYASTVIVVDDASIDNTAQIAEKAGALVVRHCLNLGQGAALQTGFALAKNLKARYVLTYDADGQFTATEIPRLLKPLIQSQCDVCLGSRFLGKTIGLPRSRLVALKLGIMFTALVSGVHLTDVHNGFRALNAKALKRIHLTQNRMEHASEIIDQIIRFRLQYQEIPVTVRYTRQTLAKGQKSLHAFFLGSRLLLNKLFN